MKIILQSPLGRLTGENCSKLLDSKSELFKFLEKCDAQLRAKYGEAVAQRRMPPHIELAHYGKEDHHVVVSRIPSVHSYELDPLEFELRGRAKGEDGPANRAFCIKGPRAGEYGQTHITVAYFPKGAPPLQELLELLGQSPSRQDNE